jgi:Peptidase_C39 like family
VLNLSIGSPWLGGADVGRWSLRAALLALSSFCLSAVGVGSPGLADGPSVTRAVPILRTADAWRPITTSARGFAQRALVSEVIERPAGFDEVIASWNLGPTEVAIGVELRVREVGGDPASEARWSPWMAVGEWSGRADSPEPSFDDPAFPTGRVLGYVDSAGRRRATVDVDVLQAAAGVRFDAAQLRLVATDRAPSTRSSDGLTEPAAGPPVRASGLWICMTDRARSATAADDAANLGSSVEAIDLAVPHLSQKTPRGELSGRLCSPTSVAMVLRYRGVPADVYDVSLRGYDRLHDLFGSWPRATQAAYSLGVPAFVTRMNSWSEVEQTLRAGQPIIASITVKPGELRNAPYASTPGHLIVITGLDGPDRVRVNDPAAGEPTLGVVHYYRGDLDKVWLERKRGTAYLLAAPVQP